MPGVHTEEDLELASLFDQMDDLPEEEIEPVGQVEPPPLDELPPPSAPEQTAPQGAAQGEVPEQQQAATAEGEEGEEDSEAWRTVRFDEDSASAHKTLLDLVRKSPAIKRAVRSFASEQAMKESKEIRQFYEPQLNEAKKRAHELEVRIANLTWNNLTREQKNTFLVNNPQYIEQAQRFERLANEPAPVETPPHIVNMLDQANEWIVRYSPLITEQDEAEVRSWVNNPEYVAQFANNPTLFVDYIRRGLHARKLALDSQRAGGQNTPVQQVVDQARGPATQSGQSRTRPPQQVVRGNSSLSKMAPAGPRSSGGSSVGTKEMVTEQQIRDMSVDEWESFLERTGNKNASEVYRNGHVKKE